MRTQANSESTSRRALLKGATATAAVAALPALAAGSQPDPIFAADRGAVPGASGLGRGGLTTRLTISAPARVITAAFLAPDWRCWPGALTYVASPALSGVP